VPVAYNISEEVLIQSNITNIVFSNFGFDPVLAFSLPNSISDTVVTYVVDDAGHCEDLVLPTVMDRDSVVKAREFELYTIQTWLGQ